MDLERFREILLAKGKNQTAFAVACGGLHPSTVSLVLRGAIAPAEKLKARLKGGLEAIGASSREIAEVFAEEPAKKPRRSREGASV